VPRESSIFCAAGMLMSDLKHNFVRTYTSRLDAVDLSRLHAIFDEMKAEGQRLLTTEKVPRDKISFLYQLDLRYQNQYHEVTVEAPADVVARGDFDTVQTIFHRRHNRLFGYSLEEENTPVELINIRLVAIGDTEKPRFAEQPKSPADPGHARKGRRRVYLPREKRFAETDVYDALALTFGNTLSGPAILEQVNTTIFVSPEYDVLVDRYGSYTLFLREKSDDIRERVLG
jgi:N-methylhydantoinase A